MSAEQMGAALHRDGSVSIYVREGRSVVVPSSSPDGGVWFEHGPLFVPRDDGLDLVECVLAALAESRAGVPIPALEDSRRDEREVWRAFGAKSRRKFMDGTKVVSVERTGSAIEVVPFRLESLRTGWIPLKGQVTLLESPSSEDLDVEIRQAISASS